MWRSKCARGVVAAVCECSDSPAEGWSATPWIPLAGSADCPTTPQRTDDPKTQGGLPHRISPYSNGDPPTFRDGAGEVRCGVAAAVCGCLDMGSLAPFSMRNENRTKCREMQILSVGR